MLLMRFKETLQDSVILKQARGDVLTYDDDQRHKN